MAKILCDNPACEHYAKVKKEGVCAAEEIQVSNEALCLTATDFTTLDERDDFKQEEGID